MEGTMNRYSTFAAVHNDGDDNGRRSIRQRRLWLFTVFLMLAFGFGLLISDDETTSNVLIGRRYPFPQNSAGSTTPTTPADGSSKASLIKKEKLIDDASQNKNNEEDNNDDTGMIEEDLEQIGTSSIDFITFNEYTRERPISWAAKTVSWGKYLAEPLKKTTFQVTCGGNRLACPTEIPETGMKIKYSWIFHDGTVLEGNIVEHVFTETGKSLVRVVRERPLQDGAMKVTVYSADVMVKYVRREIRSLTDADREALLSAMNIFYRLPTEGGKVLFGERYKGADYFMDMHLHGAGLPDCDHWHDQAGILTHHVGFTLEAEQALQVIDPSVSIPYWEYTIDTELYGTSSDDFAQSVIFSADWFGEMSPDNSLHTVTSGRWAFNPVQSDSWASVHNAYGLQRSPWNLDPTPFMTRHNRVVGVDPFGAPGCSILHSAFTQDNLADMNVYLNGATHGPVHIQIGGAWGQQTQNMSTSTMVEWGAFGYVPIMSKVLWRYGFLRFPDDCVGVTHTGIDRTENCKTSCPPEVYDDVSSGGGGGFFNGNRNHGVKNAYDVLKLTDLVDDLGVAFFKDLSYDRDDERWYFRSYDKDDDVMQNNLFKQLLDGLCDIGRVGDMFTSAAPADPIFWILHPTMERLYNWRVLLGEADVLPFDASWGYTTGKTTGEMKTVCDWSNVKDYKDLPNCVEQVCSGHNEDDMLPFEMYKAGSSTPVQMNNKELVAWIHPSSEDLPYMYDEYRWDHCEGYDFYPDADVSVTSTKG